MDTLIDRVQQAIEEDTFDRQKYSRYLIRYYNEATEAEKTLIDLCFISLCGRSLTALIAIDQQAQRSQTTLTV